MDNRFEVSPGHYEFRYVDNLVHNCDYDTNMILVACFVGFLCFCLGYQIAYGKWKIRFWKSKGVSKKMTLRGDCGLWDIWLRQRAQMVYGQHYAWNKVFDFLPEDHWFRRHSFTDREQERAAKAISEFMQICNECGCDVIIRQHTDDYDEHERYNAEQLVISSGSELTDSERNY